MQQVSQSSVRMISLLVVLKIIHCQSTRLGSTLRILVYKIFNELLEVLIGLEARTESITSDELVTHSVDAKPEC